MNNTRIIRFCVALVFSTLAVSGNATAVETLGRYPLCEGSAALLLNCPVTEDNDDCLLVADNEQADALFLFVVDNGTIKAKSQDKLRFTDNAEVSDIEALVDRGDEKILAFGSHSRNTRCEADKKRRRFAEISLSGDAITDVKTVSSNKLPSNEDDCDQLFGKEFKKDTNLNEACKVIASAEAKAQDIEGKFDKGKFSKREAVDECRKIQAFNAEGAVAIPNQQHNNKDPDGWIGLRAPLLAEHPNEPGRKNLAMLLHMEDLSAYKFDQVAFVDLDRRGIRELALEGDSVWVIAGPAADETECFQLRRFPISALSSGTGVINSQLMGSLLPSSEGLAISRKTAYVVIDGDLGGKKDKREESCKEPSRYKIIDITDLRELVSR